MGKGGRGGDIELYVTDFGLAVSPVIGQAYDDLILWL